MPSRDGDRTAEQESAGVDPGHQVGAAGDLGERLGDRGQSARVGQHRGQILELDARLGKVGHLAQQRRDHLRNVRCRRPVGSGVTHWDSSQRSMFHPAPHRVGLLLTAYIFVDVSRVRC